MFRSLATSGIALVLAAAPVLAQVTPADVWDNLSRYYTDMGYQLSVGSIDDAGDTLTLSGITFSADGESADMTITMPGMILRQTGDARVRSVIEGPISLESSSTTPEEDLRVEAVVTIPGNEMLSSGSPDDMLHEMTYPTIGIAARISPVGAEDAADMPVSLTMTGVAGKYRSNSRDGQETTYDLTAEGLDLDLSGEDTDASDGQYGSVSATSHVAGLTISGSLVVPEGRFDMVSKPHEGLAAGMVAQGSLSMGEMTGQVQFSGMDDQGAPQDGRASFASDSSELQFSVSREGLTYGGSARNTQAEMTVDGVPFPISYAIEEASGMLNFPVSKSDEPQPYRLSYTLDGLTLAEGIWNMLDPQGALPRDPASLSVDLEGEALVSADLLDPTLADRMAAAMDEAAVTDPAEPPATDESVTDESATDQTGADDADAGRPAMPMPFRPETVRIRKLLLDAVGARADLTGDLTIPEGAEQPVGTISGRFTGINALLDKLVAMGVVPQDQLMGARMMIAMFARPAGDDPDQLQTSLEFREDGSIFANGQQVK